MNHGPLIFLGVLASFVTSWWVLIFAPQTQIGSQAVAATDSGLYPKRRAGMAEQGHLVYVQNGCVHCHSQQVRQEGYTFDLTLTAVGTNPVAVAKALARIAPELKADAILSGTSDKNPQTVLKDVAQGAAESAQKRLKAAGATAQVVFLPLGVDLSRGWGTRRSVGADYLYDSPVQIGNSRLGPDLSNYGNRAPAASLILAKLYDPHSVLPGSIMPAHRYLFETRPVGRKPSPQALQLAGGAAAKPGFEIVPTEAALQLVAYLQSLRSDAPLFEAPAAPVPSTAAEAASTPAPTATPKP